MSGSENIINYGEIHTEETQEIHELRNETLAEHINTYT